MFLPKMTNLEEPVSFVVLVISDQDLKLSYNLQKLIIFGLELCLCDVDIYLFF